MGSYAFNEEGVRRLREMADRVLGKIGTGSRRRRQPPILGGGTDCVIFGPCSEYIVDEELEDSDFDVEFPGSDCLGPSRYGANLVWLSNTFSAINLEKQSDSPLLYSSDTFSITCTEASETIYLEFEVTDIDVDGCELRVIRDSDDVTIDTYTNSICSWLPLIGGYLQHQSGICYCSRIGPEICLSPPDR